MQELLSNVMEWSMYTAIVSVISTICIIITLIFLYILTLSVKEFIQVIKLKLIL